MAYKDNDVSLLENNEVHDADSSNVRSLRKGGAKTFHMLSHVFGNIMVQTLTPIIVTKLSRSDDETWKEREAIVFALGIIAEGCVPYFYPHLPELVAILLPLLDDKFPLIRRISCWTLSRYGIYLPKGSDHKSYEQFKKVLAGLLRKLLDNNKRVEKAACSAFTTLVKDAGVDLVQYLEVMLEHIICAFGTSQRENIGIVYAAIKTLPMVVREELITKPGYLEIMISSLVAKWEQLSKSDKDLYPMSECFISISQALLGTRFIPFAQAVFKRCLRIMEKQRLAKVGLTAAGVQYDKEIIVWSLDFLCDLAEGLGSGIGSLVEQSNLRVMLLGYCLDNASDVRERAFTLMGVLARVYPVYIQPNLREFLEIASKQLRANVIRENVNVATNACWAIGELAVKVCHEVSPFVTNVVSSLSLILQHGEVWDNKALIENSAITLGRLAWVCPELVAPQMDSYFEPWCMSFSMIDDPYKKEETFRGLCAVVIMNPLGVGSSLFFICQAITSWHPCYLENLMSPLISKLQQLSISDKDIFPLLKCFGSIAQALGVRFAPFALHVFHRCMDIIQIQQLAKVGFALAGAQYDKEFIIHSLDFLYDLAGGLKSEIESLVSQSNLRDMLIKYCMDEAADVREKAFALMAALARVLPVYLQPRLREFLEIASQQLIRENVIRENLYVTTNACWAIGELAVKVREEVSPIVENVVSSLGWILRLGEGVNKALGEISAITLGRLAWIRPDLVAPRMEHFVKPWCKKLSKSYDGTKKEDAFRGLCAAVKLNPSGVAYSGHFICEAIASWHEIKSEDLQKEVSQVLNVFKNMLGRSSWEKYISSLDPLVKERLARYKV